ncbi:methyltransferase domain-containing protein [Aeromonas hydrophila]|uniref:Methyltransferase domain-containing protein n=1 Tax=Aeromonas hydrophila TaxID=644 RepID=A0A926IYY7_AERHY|nr:methyltransferase domain-containing protein [Aeromonas hydrophila]
MSGLDLGCGTGFFLPALAGRCSELTGPDLAPGMLAQAALRGSGAHLLCGDAEQLPLPTRRLTGSSQPGAAVVRAAGPGLRRAAPVLKPGGRLLFSTLLAESLWQLREAWRTVDECDHVNRFLSLPQLQHAISAGGFAAPVLESLTWSLGCPELNGLLRDLKGDRRQPGQ